MVTEMTTCLRHCQEGVPASREPLDHATLALPQPTTSIMQPAVALLHNGRHGYDLSTAKVAVQQHRNVATSTYRAQSTQYTQTKAKTYCQQCTGTRAVALAS